jgi:hypothetical protein
MINPAVHLPLTAISQVCQAHRIKTLALFGSAVREDFRADSDVDVLVEFAPDAAPDFAEVVAIQEALERLIGRPVDLLERKAVEQSRNYIRRRAILSRIEPIYVA